eukprot:TRINITY_DN11596_c0_g1_i1.p1 TRINITY_DN11596_c0_g1~~TRINITY_DN11596_c0_g1_i1.p1  ORF type:complete len:223 (-),score=36.95 TRINITY_DN11596_c0_g1_i1:242-910(-)
MGTTGEFFRYKHLFMKQPTEEDKDESLALAAKLRCDVCVGVVSGLVGRARSVTEDDLADALEGNTEYEMTGDMVTDQMLSHKKGCNKHFKDELIAEGYTVRVCRDVVPGRNDSEPCLHQENSSKPGAQSIDTYELWKEGLFYACEQTVGRYGDALAARLAETLPGNTADRVTMIKAACMTEAHCNATVASKAAAGASRAHPHKRQRRRRRRQRRAARRAGEL